MPAFLSPEWIDALARAAACDPHVQEAGAGRAVGFTVVVTDGTAEGIEYHVSARAGRVEVGPGPARPENVRFKQPRTTAEAVARGELNAHEAFISGQIELSGDLSALLDHLPLLVALDRAGKMVRDQTCYGP